MRIGKIDLYTEVILLHRRIGYLMTLCGVQETFAEAKEIALYKRMVLHLARCRWCKYVDLSYITQM